MFKLSGLNFEKFKKLETSVFFYTVLFIFKIFFPEPDTVLTIIFNEILVSLAFLATVLYLSDFIKAKNPLRITLNIGVLLTIFFIICIMFYLIILDSKNSAVISNYFYKSLSLIAIFLLMFILAYFLNGFRVFFFLKQKKNPKNYYKVMIIYLILACYTYSFSTFIKDFVWLYYTFLVIAIVLISFNSLRISWIAFLPKKDKIYLLALSVVILTIFVFATILSQADWTADKIVIGQIFKLFSPTFYEGMFLILLYGSIYFFMIFFAALFHLPTAEAFDRKSEEVSSLMDLSNMITHVFDFKELAETVTKTTNKVCNTDASWLMIYNENELELSSVQNIGFFEAERVANTILENVGFQIDEIYTFNKNLFKFKHKTDTVVSLFKSFAVAPLRVHNDIKGYLFAAKKDNLYFDDEDKKAISSFADFAAVTIENSKLIKESIEKERLEKELDVAREIQSKIIPENAPQLENLKIASTFIPAFEVGGDYYDFFDLGNDKLGFIVADVSGKGISAAFIMAEIKGVFETLARIIESPRELLIKANEIIKASIEKKNFVTAVYGVINYKTGKIKLARAGHPPIFYLHDGHIARLVPPGIGLGLDSGKTFNQAIQEIEMQFMENDLLIIYTDGINEAKNASMHDFGYKRFEKVIIQNNNNDLDEMSSNVIQAVSLFSKNQAQHDDITLVIFKWKTNNKDLEKIND